MNKWKNKLISFMYGRYGVDELYYALSILWIVLYLCGFLAGVPVLRLLALACLIYMTFRMLSKNITRRRAENEAFLRVWCPVKAFLALQWARLRDGKTSVYRKCPECGATLRLPHRRGAHTAVCPRCAHRFDVHIYL